MANPDNYPIKIEVPKGPITVEGTRRNCRMLVEYLEGWLNGRGTKSIDSLAGNPGIHPALMEDLATGRMSVAQVAQRVRHNARTTDGPSAVHDVIHPRHQANFRALAPLDFLAEVSAHIPDPHEKTTIFYGWYSNRTRGFRKARGLLPPGGSVHQIPRPADAAPLAVRRSWARLIYKGYEVDPLLCPRCGASMKVIAVIEDAEVIYRILSHLNLLAPGDGPRAPPRPEPLG